MYASYVCVSCFVSMKSIIWHARSVCSQENRAAGAHWWCSSVALRPPRSPRPSPAFTAMGRRGRVPRSNRIHRGCHGGYVGGAVCQVVGLKRWSCCLAKLLVWSRMMFVRLCQRRHIGWCCVKLLKQSVNIWGAPTTGQVVLDKVGVN